MDLRQLEYFSTIADLGSFSAAALKLHISQPALSKSVSALESELKVPLFTRLPRGVVLTSPGKILRASADRIEREIRNAQSAVHDAAGLEAGQLDVACLASVTVDAAAGLIGSFHRLYPKVQIKLTQPDQDQDVRDLVSSGRCEIGFSDLAVANNREFEVWTLGSSPLLLVLPPGVSAPTEPVPLESLAQLDLVLGPAGTPARDLVDTALAEAGLATRISVEVNRRDPIEHLVLAGAGASLLPQKLAESCVVRGASAIALSPPLHREIKIFTRTGMLSPAARAYVDLARKEMVEVDSAI